MCVGEECGGGSLAYGLVVLHCREGNSSSSIGAHGSKTTCSALADTPKYFQSLIGGSMYFSDGIAYSTR